MKNETLLRRIRSSGHMPPFIKHCDFYAYQPEKIRIIASRNRGLETHRFIPLLKPITTVL